MKFPKETFKLKLSTNKNVSNIIIYHHRKTPIYVHKYYVIVINSYIF